MAALFEHVTIVGVGLLGTSLGLALRRAKLARRITGVGRAGTGSLQVAIARGAIDAATTDLAAAARGKVDCGDKGEGLPPADLVVLCTPIGQFPEALRTLAPVVSADAIVTDVGSTKAAVLRWAAELAPAVRFVGSHPMAGSEKSGPEAARVDLYRDSVCLVCPPVTAPAPADDAVARVEQLWRALEMRVIALSGEEHDRWVATISHLPHALAYVLMNAAAREPAMLQAVAGGFMDTTRVASSDATLWTDIFLTNREAALEAMRAFEADWRKLKEAVEQADAGGIHAFLERAQQAREDLLARRAAQAAPPPRHVEKDL